jgi:hypothetical protein
VSLGVALTTGTGQGIGKLVAVPFVVARACTIDRLSFEVTTGGSAGSVARCGIYRATSDTNIYPLNLVVDAGEFTTTTTGMKTATVSVALEPDILYYAVYNTGVAAPSCRLIVGTGVGHFLGVPPTNLSDGSGVLIATSAYAALPSTFPTGVTPTGGAVTNAAVAARFSV